MNQKLNEIVENINKMTESFPDEDYAGCGFWHMHLPAEQKFIKSDRTTKKAPRAQSSPPLKCPQHLCRSD
jgi:hypothetical protein